MIRRAVLSCCVFLACARAALAQPTKVFPEAQCRVTLPGNDWQWLDPKLLPVPAGKTVAFATNRRGIGFNLTLDDLKPNERPNARSYASFEHGLLQSGRFTKRAGRHIDFKGVPSYQIDVITKAGQEAVIRIMYANNRFYYLQVSNGVGPFDPQFDVEAVFNSFDFTNPPVPMLGRNEQDPAELGRAFGKALVILVVIAAVPVVLIVLGVVLYLVLRKKRRPEESLDRYGASRRYER